MDVTVSCSYLEIHHENISDLLDNDENSVNTIFQSLKVKEMNPPMQSPLAKPAPMQTKVEGLIEYKVESVWDCLHLLRIGERNRLTRMKRINLRGMRQSTLLQLNIY